MLTKNDVMLLLTEIEEKGFESAQINQMISTLARSESIPVSILKFVNDNREIEVAQFYQMLRKNYNHKKSRLYMNLVREQFDDSSQVLTTLAALNLQILLYAKKLENDKLFLKHSRAEEITYALNTYFKTYDLIPCLKALRVIKADLKLFEHAISAPISK